MGRISTTAIWRAPILTNFRYFSGTSGTAVVMYKCACHKYCTIKCGIDVEKKIGSRWGLSGLYGDVSGHARMTGVLIICFVIGGFGVVLIGVDKDTLLFLRLDDKDPNKS